MAKYLQSPGAFLVLMLEKYKLNPLKLSKDIKLSPSAVRLITIGKAKITTPVAMRLAKYFNTNPEFWLAMQMKWDVAEASKDKALAKVIKGISRVSKPSAGGNKQAPVVKKTTAKKTTAKKRVIARKPAVKKRVAAKRKPATRKKARLSGKPAAKRPVKARKKTGKRGRPAKK